MIKFDLKPVIDGSMQLVIAVTNGLTCRALFICLGLGCRSILVRSTDVEGLVATQPAIPGKHVSRQDGTDDVAQMGNIVDVGKGGGDQDVTSAFWESSSRPII